MKVHVPVGIGGRYRLSAVKDGVVQRETGWFNNIITNGGLNYLGTALNTSPPCGYCHVGTGTTAPVATDSALQTYLAGHQRATPTFSCQSTAPYYGKGVFTYTFATGEATGNISEVGIANTLAPTDSGFIMFSRALVLDGGGSPTTITVLADEQLVVTYELRYYPPLSDVVDTFTIDGDDYEITLRAMLVTNVGVWGNIVGGGSAVGTVFNTLYTGAIGAITSSPSTAATSGDATSQLADSYSNNSLTRTYQYVWGTAAVGSITAISWTCGMGGYQMGVSPALPKLNTQTFTIHTQVTWARKTL